MDALSRFEVEEVRVAAEIIRDGSRWFPAIADIVAAIEGTLEEEIAEQWEAICAGGTEANEIAAALMRRLFGDYYSWSRMTVWQQQQCRRSFAESYKAAALARKQGAVRARLGLPAPAWRRQIEGVKNA